MTHKMKQGMTHRMTHDETRDDIGDDIWDDNDVTTQNVMLHIVFFVRIYGNNNLGLQSCI